MLFCIPTFFDFFVDSVWKIW